MVVGRRPALEMRHHFHQYAPWLQSKDGLHLSHYFLAQVMKNDPLVYQVSQIDILPLILYVYLKSWILSFVIEPCRMIRYNSVSFSPILSYILHDSFIGKSVEMEFSWGYIMFRKNDAWKSTFQYNVILKKNEITFDFFPKLYLFFDPKESL